MLRILQIVNIMDRAGLETMLMNYYRNIDRDKIQFDFLTHRPEKGAYEDEILSMGGKVYHAPRLYPQNFFAYKKYMKDFFSKHPEYKIVHSHIDAMSAFPLACAKKANVPIRIAHSHNTDIEMDWKYPIKRLAKNRVPRLANVYCACGKDAGKFIFGNAKFHVINNAINVNNFSFDVEVRTKKRVELSLSDELVIGHVGRFRYVKNQEFLIDIFCEVLKKRERSILMLIGKGEDEEKLRQKVSELGIDQKVKFLIDRADVAELYQTMDVFVMPSLFEGLPVVAIEAQANGLPMIISDKISKETIVASNASVLPIQNNPSEWADRILSLDLDRNSNALEEMKNGGFDVSKEATKLSAWYMKLANIK